MHILKKLFLPLILSSLPWGVAVAKGNHPRPNNTGGKSQATNIPYNSSKWDGLTLKKQPPKVQQMNFLPHLVLSRDLS